MFTLAVIGAQWGDEGKGKIVDLLAEDATAVARFHGGNNAGHTLITNGKKTVLHTLPSSITRKDVIGLCMPYEVIDLEVVAKELKIAQEHNATVVIDAKCPVILPIDIAIDRGREKSKGKNKIGTTCRGIGPTYEAFASRRHITIGDVVAGAHAITEKLTSGSYYEERRAIAQFHGEKAQSLNECVEFLLQFTDTLKSYVGDTAKVISDIRNRYLNRVGKVLMDRTDPRQLVDPEMPTKPKILFEGAQAVMLDVLNGTQPYVTSSFCMPHIALAQCDISKFDRIIGVTKAYCTRVGGGPFPTEIHEGMGDIIREKGGEYGATTGRPRRVGWLDLVQLRYAIKRASITELALTKIDVLSGLQEISMCTAYLAHEGIEMDMCTLTTHHMGMCTPQFLSLSGWDEDISKISKFGDLPQNARNLISAIERAVDCPVTIISNGPDRNCRCYIFRG